MISVRELSVASARVSHAERELKAARDELSRLQREFDEQTAHLRATAPEGTEWKKQSAA